MLLSPGAWLGHGLWSVLAAPPPVSASPCWWVTKSVELPSLPTCSDRSRKDPQLRGGSAYPPGTKATREAGGLLSGAPPTRKVLSNVLSPCSHGNKPRSPSFCDFPLSFFLGDSDGKGSTCSAGDLDLIPGPGRSPGEGNGYPLQYSCLDISTERGAWQATAHGSGKESETTERITLSSIFYTIYTIPQGITKVPTLSFFHLGSSMDFEVVPRSLF